MTIVAADPNAVATTPRALTPQTRSTSMTSLTRSIVGVQRQNTSQASAEAKAAREFEGMLLQQLMQVLRKTVPDSSDGGGDSAGGKYMQMFDETIATAMAEGGGIGLAQVMSRAFGGEDAQGSQAHAGLGPVAGISPTFRALSNMQVSTTQSGIDALRPLPAPHGERLGGGVGALQQVARQLLAGGDGARWAKEQSLTEHELQSQLATEAAGGVARFNVRDANGYQGYNKCNLFAFEMARRAGYAVPVVARLHGWGFPNSNTVTNDASDDRALRGDWGRVVTGASVAELDRAIVGQGRAFMLSGSATEGRSGHMAVIERVHDVKYGKDGEVRSIDFDGWEARPDGASHLVRRRWNRFGEGSDAGARNGLQDIEIIELMRPAPGHTQETLVSDAHAASVNDQAPQDLPATARTPGWRQR